MQRGTNKIKDGLAPSAYRLITLSVLSLNMRFRVCEKTKSKHSGTGKRLDS